MLSQLKLEMFYFSGTSKQNERFSQTEALRRGKWALVYFSFRGERTT